MVVVKKKSFDTLSYVVLKHPGILYGILYVNDVLSREKLRFEAR